MAQHYVGALGYADDIILLCPSLAGVKKMIKICEDYAKEHDILFNGNKSKYLIFGDYKYKPTLLINNEIVSRCESALHLGHLLHTKNTKNELIGQAIKDFNRSYHGFMSKFDTCNTTTKNKLFHQYCSSMYGSQLWDMTSQNAVKMHTKWRNAHRQILKVPNTTHRDILPLIANNMPIECILDCKYIAFYKSIATSENKILNHMSKNRLYIHSSTLGRNMTHLMYKYGLKIEDMISLPKNRIKDHCYNKWSTNIIAEYPHYAQIIRDMFAMKEGRCNRIFTNEDCNLIINFFCTI